MRIAVTGASGFIGRHVLQALAQRAVEVVAVVRDTSRMPVNATRAVALNLADADANSYTALGRPDLLLHLAWQGLPNYRSLHHFEQELPTQYRFLRQLLDAGLPALLVTGTCFEYGMRCGPLAETLPPAPDNPYGHAKAALLQQLQFLRTTHPFALTWARLFYLHGPGQAPTALLPQLQAAVARGDATFPMSGGEQLRDYLPAATAASLLVDLALQHQDAGIVNVCSGQPTSVRQLVEQWLTKHGASIRLDLGHYPYPDYEPMAFWGCRHKLDSLLAPPTRL